MPTPEQANLTFYTFRPESTEDHAANLRQTDRWANRLPFFPDYGISYFEPAGFTNTLGGIALLIVDPALPVEFELVKTEGWTDLRFEVHLSGYLPSVAGGKLSLYVVINDDSAGAAFEIATTYINPINEHAHISGIRWIRVPSDLRLSEGRYTCGLYYVATQDFRINNDDFVTFTGREVLPSSVEVVT